MLGACSGLPSGQQSRPEYLTAYIDAHYQDLGKQFIAPMTRDQFQKRLGETRVLFLGDHHRDPGLHAQIMELISWLAKRGLQPVLGVEAIGIQDVAILQEFLTGDIGLDQLRRSTKARWSDSWLDNPDVDQSFYRDLLKAARQQRLPVFCLEPTPRHPLARRDTMIASNIRRALRLHPDNLIVVIVGHAHLLGQGHLVGRVGAPALAVAARFSPRLRRAAAGRPDVEESSFLQTERGILFFPGTPTSAADTQAAR